MLQLVARLLVALGVTAGGLAGAQGHASPAGSAQSAAALEAVATAVGTGLHQLTANGELRGLDLAQTKANDHAAKGLATAVAAKAAGQAKGAAARDAGAANAGSHAPTPPTAATDNPGASHRP